ncbi:MAG: 30S ribosomal protein S18 [Candidatus Spechtbacterales bacterium]|nr:30S ribosomal protein S18 [Candidatus Spechtbacterales bacterium]
MTKHCYICKNQVKIDWKNDELLKRFMDSYFRILRAKTTGTCAKHQRQIAKAIKRARHMGIVPYTSLIEK